MDPEPFLLSLDPPRSLLWGHNNGMEEEEESVSETAVTADGMGVGKERSFANLSLSHRENG